VGATLVLRFSTAVVIGLALLVVVGATITALQFRRSTEPWVLATGERGSSGLTSTTKF
jgi:hypothetical protein